MDIQIIETKVSVPTVMVDGYLLHSKYNPIREAKQFAESMYIPHTIHVLYGNGLGYIVQALLEQFQFDEKLIVIEPFLEVKEKLERVIYVEKNNLDNLDKALAVFANSTQEITFKPSLNYDKLDSNIYLGCLRTIRNRVYGNKVSINTIVKTANVWYENYINNIKFAIEDTSVGKLFGKYDCPVVVAAGGPSLTKQLPLVKNFRNRIMLISAGSTINSLLAEGIIPDYVVNIDGGKHNVEHYHMLSRNPKIKYIYSLNATYEIRKNTSNESYYFTTNRKVIDKSLLDLIGEIEEIDGGSSVATFCLSLATKLTTGPIAMIGQDLAYTNNVTHAENNKGKRQIELNKTVKIEGYYGQEVFTDASLISMKNDFELMIKLGLSKKHVMYNCTEGGAKINGISQLPFATFCEKHVQNQQEFIDFENRNNEEYDYDLFQQYIQKQLVLVKQTESLIQGSLLTLKKDFHKGFFEKNTIQKLEKSEKKIKESLSMLNLTYLVDKILIIINHDFPEKVKETKAEAFTRVYNQNEFLYTELISNLKYIKDILTTIEI
ncbi:6-hydroxymethylpterin diphosphokinase MptE-like protein [Bacillaceae bacterium CLA-AA-H227]|uniref:6-hydroxymethylpterin diphosphokinase MptE-like protein n=1 Tax=Robertmurraya yapensis (ex Hitch et al 2024) TaxID=3133160 RepID=A0ACC6SCA4_9BACI